MFYFKKFRREIIVFCTWDQEQFLEWKWDNPIKVKIHNATRYLPFQYKTEYELIKRDKYTKITLQQAVKEIILLNKVPKFVMRVNWVRHKRHLATRIHRYIFFFMFFS